MKIPNHEIDTIVREAAARLDHEIMTAGRAKAAYEFRDLLEDHIRQALELAIARDNANGLIKS